MQAHGKGRMLWKALVQQFQQCLHVAAVLKIKDGSGCCSKSLSCLGWLT